MSGLLALLDDVAAIAKVAAASIDDVAAQAAKAGSKAAGAVIDDAAVTPRYVHGFEASRELPIVWRIARGSIRNKLLILLPIALTLSALAPAAVYPLLMLGGAYLCFEGAEKVLHVFFPHADEHVHKDMSPGDPLQLEEERVAGAIKTDFILSAEIMTIALAALPDSSLLMKAVTLAIVAVGITAAVYGGVALIVKADDVGLFMSLRARLGVTRALGRAIVRGMPPFLKALAAVGTAAMLWVGGSIVVHGMEQLGAPWLAHHIHHAAAAVAAAGPAEAGGTITWTITAALDAAFGLLLGLALVPLVTRVALPLWKRLTD